MAVRTLIKPNSYRDSVYLMTLSSQAREESGAAQVSAMMGTVRNKDLFHRSGLGTPELDAAKPDDLVIAIEADESRLDETIAVVERLLNAAPAKKSGSGEGGVQRLESLDQALAVSDGFDLALISVAGDYARYESAKALAAGMDVMLYSDNVSLEDELALKTLASRKQRIVMGPDCGTAIIDGVPLAFANSVRRGPVGLVAASGTGLQEVCCLLDRLGVGISNAYGTGGRDLKDAIGGITTLAVLDRLIADPETTLIGILGKPPGKATRAKLIERIKACKKPVAVHFLGATEYDAEDANRIPHASDMTEFALLLARQVNPGVDGSQVLDVAPPVPAHKPGFLRGLFSGGTLCYEAAELAAPILRRDLYSNLDVSGFSTLDATQASRGHAFWDFGEDEFTVGRPHPMMAPELRMDRLLQELSDPLVSVILLDLVIGHGAADGQAEAVVKTLEKAAQVTAGKSREKVVVVAVCGTEGDRPSRSEQVSVLAKGGVVVLGSNSQAALWAAQVAKGEQ